MKCITVIRVLYTVAISQFDSLHVIVHQWSFNHFKVSLIAFDSIDMLEINLILRTGFTFFFLYELNKQNGRSSDFLFSVVTIQCRKRIYEHISLANKFQIVRSSVFDVQWQWWRNGRHKWNYYASKRGDGPVRDWHNKAISRCVHNNNMYIEYAMCCTVLMQIRVEIIINDDV